MSEGAVGWVGKTFSERRLLILAGVVILFILIYLRMGLMQYQGLFEPDGFFYYTAIKQAIANHFMVGTYVNLSGYPYHGRLNERPLMLYFVLAPYAILQFLGVSSLTVMRWIAPFFGILDAIAAYWLAKKLSKSEWLGLSAALMIALSSGNIARTAGTVFRGDTFISFLAMLALLILIKMMEIEDKKKRYMYMILGGALISTGNLVWNGGVLVPALSFGVLSVYAAYAFIVKDQHGMRGAILGLGSVAIAMILAQLWVYLGWANPNVFTTPYFFISFLPIAIGALAGYYANNKWNHTTMLSRLTAFAIVGLVGAVVMLVFFYSAVSALLTNNNAIFSNNNIAKTTQELQAPTWAFIWSSFGVQNFLGPIGVLMFILFAHKAGNKSHKKLGPITLNVNYGFLAMLVYLLMAVYLQLSGIRYNSILSIPLAIFSAYAIFGGEKVVEGWKIKLSGTTVKISHIYMALVIALLADQFLITQGQSASSIQADGINQPFLQAMTWLSNNTAPNAKILDLWPDGSVVEGWGNRQSFQDSVGGENSTRIFNFSQWIFAPSTQSGYLINKAFRPDYLVARNFWFEEIGGIAVEGNVTGNLTGYGYDQLNTFSIQGNASLQRYKFSSPSFDAYLVVSVNSTTGQKRIGGLLGPPGSNRLTILKSVIFFNATSDNYSVSNATNPGINYSLLLTYSGRNISSAAVLGGKLVQTNFFKFLLLCGYTQCSYQDNNVTATLAYANADTKIIRFTYH